MHTGAKIEPTKLLLWDGNAKPQRHCVALSHQHMTKRSDKHRITVVLPQQQQEVERKVQQASKRTHSCPHVGEHASGVSGLTGDHCATQLSSLCKQRMVNTRQGMDSTLPMSPGAEYAKLQSRSRALLCVLFVCFHADMILSFCLLWNTFIF